MSRTPGLDSDTVGTLRAAPRHPCVVQTTCQPPSGWRKDPWPATIRDIATDGLCLCLNRRFEPGSGLAIELPGEDGSSNTVLARVSSVHTVPEGGWMLGCTFISELGDDEVRAVLQLDPLRQASLDDGETPPRRGKAASVEGVLFQARSPQGDVLRWFVKHLDLSGGWPIPDRKAVSFRVAGRPGEGMRVNLILKRSRRIGSYWIIDCKFPTPPSDDVLRALTAPSEEDAVA